MISLTSQRLTLLACVNLFFPIPLAQVVARADATAAKVTAPGTTMPSRVEISSQVLRLNQHWFLEITVINSTTSIARSPRVPRRITISRVAAERNGVGNIAVTQLTRDSGEITMMPDEGYIHRIRLDTDGLTPGRYRVDVNMGGSPDVCDPTSITFVLDR
jgi:hypothetical protein